MQFAQRQRLFRSPIRPLLAGIPIGLFLGFLGPFGSNPGFPTATRYGFWLGLTIAGVAAVLAADAVMPTRQLRAGLPRILAVALFSSVPMTFVVAWTVTLVQPGRNYSPSQLLALFWGVAAVQLVIVCATVMASSHLEEEASATLDEAPPPEARAPNSVEFPHAFLSKLPAGIGNEVLALETEDHYLRVHAVAGTGLILMRMADAVALLGPQLGVQVHRRWWVSGSAVVEMRYHGQKQVLRLTNNLLVPIGRTFGAIAKGRFGQLKSRDDIVSPYPDTAQKM